MEVLYHPRKLWMVKGTELQHDDKMERKKIKEETQWGIIEFKEHLKGCLETYNSRDFLNYIHIWRWLKWNTSDKVKDYCPTAHFWHRLIFLITIYFKKFSLSSFSSNTCAWKIMDRVYIHLEIWYLAFVKC